MDMHTLNDMNHLLNKRLPISWKSYEHILSALTIYNVISPTGQFPHPKTVVLALELLTTKVCVLVNNSLGTTGFSVL